MSLEHFSTRDILSGFYVLKNPLREQFHFYSDEVKWVVMEDIIRCVLIALLCIRY